MVLWNQPSQKALLQVRPAEKSVTPPKTESPRRKGAMNLPSTLPACICHQEYDVYLCWNCSLHKMRDAAED